MKPIRTRPERLQRGIAALEFAIVALLVMVPLAFGISELGRAIMQYNTLAKATRDAARYLTMFTPGTRTDAARCLAVSGNVAIDAAGGATCLGQPLLPGLGSGNVAIEQSAVVVPDVGDVNLVTVTIHDYAFVSLVPIVIPDITLGPIRTTMRAPS